jgi:hypothetical protein
MKTAEGFAWLSLACTQTRLAGGYLMAAGTVTTAERHIAELREWRDAKARAWASLKQAAQVAGPVLP